MRTPILIRIVFNIKTALIIFLDRLPKSKLLLVSKRTVTVAVAALSLSVLTHSQHAPPVPRVAQPESVQAVVRATGLFSTALYRVLSKGMKGNLQISPLNLVALLMAVSSNDQQSLGEFVKVLRLNSTEVSFIPEGFNQALNVFNGTDPSQFEFGTRLFVDLHNSVDDEFRKLIEKVYLTTVQMVDFKGDPETAGGAAVTWLESMTRYRVNLPIHHTEFGTDTMLLLAATSFLQTKWERKYFKVEDTRWEPFHSLSGRIRYARFMHCTATFLYAEYYDMKVVQIPLAGGRLAVWIMLPRNEDGFAALESQIDFRNITNIPRMAYQNVIISLPRFQLHNSIKLKPALKKLGLADMFNNGVDLPGGKELKVDNVVARSFLDVGEQTEKEEDFAFPSRKSGEREFIANRPFILLVRDIVTDSILLIGRVADIK
ncbi:serpin B3 [Anabrus simplex]|uniref:serpin B3 n=1 Tax=Anabrus simplex TaxID=316456 RepID=UPI0035A3A4FF